VSFSFSLCPSNADLRRFYSHFLLFITEFNLVEKKELAPLAELVDSVLTAAV
jgi:MOB kinase activator 1